MVCCAVSDAGVGGGAGVQLLRSPPDLGVFECCAVSGVLCVVG
jgi:hypothetical protein